MAKNQSPTQEDGSRVTQIIYRLPETIDADPSRNNRFGTYKESDLADLLDDLAKGIGIETPVLCTKKTGTRDELQLEAGFRRHAAVTLHNSRVAPSKAVRLPVIIRQMNADEAMDANIRENAHRHNYRPMDYAVGIRNLRNAGRSDESICATYGEGRPKSPAWIIQTSKLLSLERKIQERIQADEIPGSVGILLADMSPENRKIVIAAHDQDGLKFTKSTTLKMARQCGAVADGGQGKGKKAEGVPQSTASEPAVKRHQRTLKEVREYLEDLRFSPTVNKDGQRLIGGLMQLIEGKMSEDEMNAIIWSLFPKPQNQVGVMSKITGGQK